MVAFKKNQDLNLIIQLYYITKNIKIVPVPGFYPKLDVMGYSTGMKIKRSWVLYSTAGIGVFMILYSLVRHFFKIGFGEAFEKTFFDGLFIAAAVLFVYNRKLSNDDKKSKAAEAKAEADALAAKSVEAEEISDDEEPTESEDNPKNGA
jgi:hypothetical protein